MKGLKRIFSYLINPRSAAWNFSNSGEVVQPGKRTWKGILNPPLILGAIIITGLIIIVWFGPHLASYDPYITSRSRPSYFDAEKNMMIRPPFDPAPEYPLGTDRFGNDLLSLILYGARATLISCLYITAGRLLLGLTLGGISGWLEGSWFDRLIMRISTVISSIPLLLSAMLMILALGIHKGVWVFVVSLSILGWTEIAQQVRAEFISIRGLLFIEAAEALGMNRAQIIVRHALPNVLSRLMSLSFLEMGSILLIMAELGFLDIFVGGASKFKSDPYIPVVILLNKIPEWSALVAQGTPFIRGYPYLVFGPTIAFFISILGFNSFGEGLRRLFDRWPISTAFLLKKRMLLITAGFIGLSLVIFQMTNASVSYQKLAESLQQDRLQVTFEDLKRINGFGSGSEENPLVSFISASFADLGLKKGYSEVVNSTYYFPAEVTVVKPIEEPRLIIRNSEEYIFQKDYAFLSEGCAGSGSGQGQLVLFGGGVDDLAHGQGNDFNGKIILTLEESYSPEFAQMAARQGVGGMLVVSREQPPLASQFEISSVPDSNLCLVEKIPVYMISERVASEILDQAHLDWEEQKTLTFEEKQILPLDIQVELELTLSEPERVSVPNVIGFIGGYDMDHANEILVVYMSFDGLGLTAFDQEGVPETDLAEIALLLEILSTWDEFQLDPRRSVQFVLWGGEGVVEPYNDLITGIFEKNHLAAKVPTRSIKPALWLEISDLNPTSERMSYSSVSTDFMVDLYKKAARAGGVKVDQEKAGSLAANIDIPGLYLGELSSPVFDEAPEISAYIQQGVVINRVLIQVLRDMEIGKTSP